MNAMNTIFGYLLMAAVTLGWASVPDAIMYEHPSLIFSRWYRDDLDV